MKTSNFIQLNTRTATTPIIIVLYIIDKCNYTCNYCYNIQPRTYKTLLIDDILQFIKHIYKTQKREIHIELIGGEPTLYKDIFNLYKELNSLDYIKQILIYSNFSWNFNNYLKILDLSIKNKLYLTYHYMHNMNNFINNAKYLLNIYNQQIHIVIMYEHNNIKNVLNIFDQLYQDNALINLRLVDDVLNTYSLDEQHEYLNRNQLQYYNIAYLNSDLTNTQSIQISSQDFNLNQKLLNFHNWKCYAGQDYLYIHVDGNIYPCPDYFYVKKQPIGNIYMYKQLKYKPTLCSTTRCICGIDIVKQNIFKI